MRLFGLCIAEGAEEVNGLEAEVALQDYLAVLDGAADAAAGLELTPQLRQVGIVAHEAAHQGDGFATTPLALIADAQALL